IVNANITYFRSALSHMLEIKKRFPGVLEKMLTDLYAPEEYSKAYFSHGRNSVKVAIDWRKN
ncbi:MAG: hypothetical protein QXP70_02570, partial [Methanomassiliicoccales archaeon]